MKILIAILFVFTSASCYSQVADTITIDDLKKSDTFIQEDDGFWRIRYDNGNIKIEGNFRRRWSFYYFRTIKVPFGKWKYFSREGRLVKIEEYNKRGKLVRVTIIPPNP